MLLLPCWSPAGAVEPGPARFRLAVRPRSPRPPALAGRARPEAAGLPIRRDGAAGLNVTFWVVSRGPTGSYYR